MEPYRFYLNAKHFKLNVIVYSISMEGGVNSLLTLSLCPKTQQLEDFSCITFSWKDFYNGK